MAIKKDPHNINKKAHLWIESQGENCGNSN